MHWETMAVLCDVSSALCGAVQSPSEMIRVLWEAMLVLGEMMLGVLGAVVVLCYVMWAFWAGGR